MDLIKKDFKLYISSPRKNKYIKISEGSKWSSGSECYFFDTEKGGFKLYEYKSEAKVAMNSQKKANEKGLAPDVLSEEIIEIDLRDNISNSLHDDARDSFLSSRVGKKFYGYFTEIVDVLDDYTLSEKLFFAEEISKLSGKLNEIFDGRFTDLRFCNVGIKEAKLVGIDFGLCSFKT